MLRSLFPRRTAVSAKPTRAIVELHEREGENQNLVGYSIGSREHSAALLVSCHVFAQDEAGAMAPRLCP